MSAVLPPLLETNGATAMQANVTDLTVKEEAIEGHDDKSSSSSENVSKDGAIGDDRKSESPLSESHGAASDIGSGFQGSLSGSESSDGDRLPGIRTDEQGREVYYCHLCSYSGNSKFHFNSHIATHFEHRCPKCDYTSRTEGRLFRHLRDFHAEKEEEGGAKSDGMNSAEGGSGEGASKLQKAKLNKCKQCPFSSYDREEFWTHARSHIKEDKILQCPKCPFVTEYKHHLEYHLRNHFGSKPFKCIKCDYSCVNKSMLNSHMKSHTNIYQYRCAECSYATKYCHSLKLHLKKYGHQPSSMLTSEGAIIEGEGIPPNNSAKPPPKTPLMKKLAAHGTVLQQGATIVTPRPQLAPSPLLNFFPAFLDRYAQSQQLPNTSGYLCNNFGQISSPNLPPSLNMVMNLSNQSATKPIEEAVKREPVKPKAVLPTLVSGDAMKCNACGFMAPSWAEVAQHVLHTHSNIPIPESSSSYPCDENNEDVEVVSDEKGINVEVRSDSGFNTADKLSSEYSGGSAQTSPSIGQEKVNPATVSGSAISPGSCSQRKRTRKGKAVKLPSKVTVSETNSSEDSDNLILSEKSSENDHAMAAANLFECYHCNIIFRDCVMYTIHMGYHGYQDPYQCNMCGVQCGNKIEFYLHIARVPHT